MQVPEPGWYDDWQDATMLRWWDGARWTDRRQPRAAAEPPPPPPPASPPPPDSGSYGIPLADPQDPWGSGSGSGGPGSGGPGSGGPGSGGSGSGGSGGSGAWDSAAIGSAGGAWGAAAGGGGGGGGGGSALGAAPPRTFVEAIKVCLTKYIDAKGRASRSEYWYFALFTFLLGIVTGGVSEIFVLLPSLTVAVRRLHDIGRSGWALLWIFVPIVGWILLIVYAVRPGEPVVNAYG